MFKDQYLKFYLLGLLILMTYKETLTTITYHPTNVPSGGTGQSGGGGW